MPGPEKEGRQTAKIASDKFGSNISAPLKAVRRKAPLLLKQPPPGLFCCLELDEHRDQTP